MPYRILVIALSMIALLPLSAASPDDDTLFGFTSATSHAERDWENKFRAIPDPKNLRDYMQRLTNDRLPSTSHRVGKPTNGSHRESPRVSFPMAVYVWEDEVLEVLPGLGAPKYEPIKAITFHTRSTSKFYGDDYAVETA